MTRQDVINNIMTSYGDCDIPLDWLEDLIIKGEQKGLSYRAIYNIIRIGIGAAAGTREVFTVAETAEALGVTEDKVIEAVERLNEEAEAAGKGKDYHYKKIDPDTIQRFVVRPGEL